MMEVELDSSSDDEEIQVDPELPNSDDVFDANNTSENSNVLQCELCQQMFTHKVRYIILQ